ncbi:nucleotidyl cyclase domain-containing protein [Pseudothermotoga thermarum]|uniref:GGDEF domain-containing protein n=1 Tax=Pseudothermotoga thermarum DSM 5069 TaxID=688269 RepID=F7YWA2_9THEM|nr:hypothetical protein [Pseudothermotoga thermarum]AEH51874.1 hypothetical protein Theth_1832 [Pseudothermotoga thermarum DSM 5069]
MVVYVKLSESETKRKILQAISLCNAVATVDENIADICISDSLHLLLETVIVSEQPPKSFENVVDVILPDQPIEYYIMKMRMIQCYVYSGCSVSGMLEEEIYKARRHNIPLSAVFVQILSDSTLATQTVYVYAKKLSRISDKVVVLQPSTILVLLPYTSVDGAKVFATRLLRQIERAKIRGLTTFPDVVLSVCQIDDQMSSYEDLILKFEDAVKKAFQSGRKIILA